MSVFDAFSLKGHTALVTGSSRGIGRGIAKAFAEAGAKVIVHGTKMTDKLTSAATECGGLALAAELGTPGASEKLIAACRAQNAMPDILVLNASVQDYVKVEDFTEEEFLREYRVNVQCSFELTKLCIPYMRERRWGRILGIGSVNALRPAPRLSIYATTKAALSNLMQTIASQYGPDGITANTLQPGVICTDRNEKILSNQEFSDNLMNMIPARRFGNVNDCAGAALLICSEAGGYITGAQLPIAGGLDL